MLREGGRARWSVVVCEAHARETTKRRVVSAAPRGVDLRKRTASSREKESRLVDRKCASTRTFLEIRVSRERIENSDAKATTPTTARSPRAPKRCARRVVARERWE